MNHGGVVSLTRRRIVLLDGSRRLAARRRLGAERLLREFEEKTRGCF